MQYVTLYVNIVLIIIIIIIYYYLLTHPDFVEQFVDRST